MNVKVDINKNDYWNYNKFMVKTIKKFTHAFIVNMMIMPFTALVVLIMLKVSILFTILGTILGGVIGDLFLIGVTKRQVFKELKKKEEILGKHTFEIYKQNLKEITSKGDKLYLWSNIKDVDENKDYIYIFLGGVEAKIIPKRCFESGEEAKRFYDETFGCWESKNKKNNK